MNYLALCKRLRQEAGITGDGPTTTVSQTGQLKRVVDWVMQAWIDIQIMRPDWLFMNSEFTFDTVAATRDYLAADHSIADLKLWDTNSFLIYETAVGESDQSVITYLPYKKWRNQYRPRMNDRNDDRPQLFTITPDNKVRFEPRPDKIYTIEGDYKLSTQTLSADDDELTGLPEDFHMAIVWKALMYYAHYEDAGEVMDEAEVNFGNLQHRLEIEQLPDMDTDYEALA